MIDRGQCRYSDRLCAFRARNAVVLAMESEEDGVNRAEAQRERNVTWSSTKQNAHYQCMGQKMRAEKIICPSLEIPLVSYLLY